MGIVDQVENDEVSPNAFILSTEERKSDWKRISAWETSLTTAEQAFQLVGKPKRKVIIPLVVGEIRQITVEGNSPLNVLWDRLSDCIDEAGRRKKGYRDGCMGHCGITGIDLGSKALRKQLRRRLAELATRSGWYLIDEIPF